MKSSEEDVTVLKVISAKNISSKTKPVAWVTSSFDDFNPVYPAAKVTVKEKPIQQWSSSKQSTKKDSSTLPFFFTSSRTVKSSSHKRPRDTFPAHRLTTQVKSETQRQKLKSALGAELWSDKYQPKKRDDLAVHKKKVEDICTWLREKSTKICKHAAPILLLTGPSGIGKTALVKTLASELKLEIQEWVNPTVATGDTEFRPLNSLDRAELSSVDVFTSQSQSTLFSSFLLRANKYQSLQLSAESSTFNKSQGKIILVEDFPNAFFRDVTEFHNILRKFQYSGHCPLVFVVSDASSGSSILQRLFPPELQEELRLDTISVNPVAPTMMIKVLNKIASSEASQGKFHAPSAQVVESIAMSSGGDIRAAINALQFACRRDTADLQKIKQLGRVFRKESSGMRKRLKYGNLSKQDSTSDHDAHIEGVIGAKDASCFLFHALGKILHFKRGEPAEHSDHPTLPSHLSHHARDPLLLNPEEVVEKTHLSGDYFNTLLHQNYLDFLQQVEDVERAAEYLSDADLVSSQYSSRGELVDYSVSLASRGYIHSDSTCRHYGDTRKSLGWRPLHKSQWFNVLKQASQSKSTATILFRGYHWNPEVLLTEIVPFISLTNPTLHDPGQISFVQDICQFTKLGTCRPRLEILDEKEVVEDEIGESQTSIAKSVSCLTGAQTDDTTSITSASLDLDIDESLAGSQTNVKVVTADCEDEEDYAIEEFND